MSDKTKQDIELFLNHGIYLPTRTIEESGPVDDEMYVRLVKKLHILDEHKVGTITIKFKSEGGSLDSARAIVDSILNCKNRVRIIGYGELASAATIILQAADDRVLGNNAKIMIHRGVESVPEDHPRNVQAMFDQHRTDETWMEDIYLKKIKEKKKRFTRQKLKEMLEFDRYMNAKEAFEVGLIDVIGVK